MANASPPSHNWKIKFIVPFSTGCRSTKAHIDRAAKSHVELPITSWRAILGRCFFLADISLKYFSFLHPLLWAYNPCSASLSYSSSSSYIPFKAPHNVTGFSVSHNTPHLKTWQYLSLLMLVGSSLSLIIKLILKGNWSQLPLTQTSLLLLSFEIFLVWYYQKANEARHFQLNFWTGCTGLSITSPSNKELSCIPFVQIYHSKRKPIWKPNYKSQTLYMWNYIVYLIVWFVRLAY